MEQRQIFQIPIDNKYILYRPLLSIAFVANEFMSNIAAELIDTPNKEFLEEKEKKAALFLNEIGFLRPDPFPPKLDSIEIYRPICATLFLTNRCNLRCTYCYASTGDFPIEEMPLDLAKRAIDHVHKYALERGMEHFELAFHGGGEPTLNWEILTKAVGYARSKDLPADISVSSNGIYTPKRLDWIINHLDGLSLSLDGPPHVQDRQRITHRGKGSFKNVIKSVEYFDKWHFAYGIRMTVTPESIPKHSSSVQFLINHTGTRQIQVEPVFPGGRGGDEWINEEDLDVFIEQFKEAYSIAFKHGVELIYSGARPSLITPYFCRAAYDALIVTSSGEISACFEVYSRDHPLSKHFFFGKFNDNGTIYIDYQRRHELLDSRSPDKLNYCQNCFCKWHCVGDCISKTFSNTAKDHFKPSPRCKVNREITKFLIMKKIAAAGGVWAGG